MSKSKIVPVLGLALALASSAGVLVLQQRQARNHRAELALANLKNELNQLEGLPWQAENPRFDTPARIRSAMAGSERGILAEIETLRRGPGSPAALDAALAPLRANFAVNDAIFEAGLSPAGWTRRAPTALLAQRQTTTLTDALGDFARAGAVYAHRVEVGAWVNRIGGVGTIVLLVCAFLFYYRRSERVTRVQAETLRAKTEAHERLKQTTSELTRAETERARLLERTVAVAEHERIRLAIDLHDGPIQQLTALAFNLDRLGLAVDRRELTRAGELMELVRTSLTSEMHALRRLMVELRPPVLDEGGLSAALADAAGEVLEGAPVDVEIRCAVAKQRLAPELETAIYRVVREALVNVRKHADASAVQVLVEPGEEELRLVVADDGRGFDTDAPATSPGGVRYGLLGMKERVEGLGGDWEIVSAPDAGTRILATLPMKTRERIEAAREPVAA